ERDDDVSRRHNLLTPDISLGYSFNEESQISLSYKMATVKPPYSQLTGSLSYVGIHQIEGGNPLLRDERMHDVQLFGMWKGFMLQTDFTRSLDTYTSEKQLYPAANLQLLLHPINIDLTSFSLYLVWSKPVKWWTPDITVGMYRQWLELDGTKYNRPLFSYYFYNTFSLPGGWLITANISGYTGGDMRTTRFGKSLFTMDASVGKTFFNKSLTVKLSATDIFNTANNDWTMNTFGIYVDKKQSNDNRGIALNIIYNFQPYKSKYRGSSASETELNRL
ncbi:MAG: outer membrane beta-barrel protein, partial [Lachnospiraceae bacterium]|nr:outer membrane beta-barrel protein [Lachnospiraceae bacterium]